MMTNLMITSIIIVVDSAVSTVAMSFEEQSCQIIPLYFSRILIELQWYLQKLNLNLRIGSRHGLKKIDNA